MWVSAAGPGKQRDPDSGNNERAEETVKADTDHAERAGYQEAESPWHSCGFKSKLSQQGPSGDRAS